MSLTKAQLEALNESSFPNNTEGLITPEILRNYNSQSIDNTVNQADYTADSASFNSRIEAITGSSVDTASFVTTSSFNAFTSSYYTDSASFSSRINNVSGSNIDTASFATTGSNIFVGDQLITGSLLVTQAVSESFTTLGIENKRGAGTKLKYRQETGTNSLGYRLNLESGVDNTTSSVYEIGVNPSNNYISLDVKVPFQVSNQTNINGQTTINSIGGLLVQQGPISASNDLSASAINGIGNVSQFSASVDNRINSIVVGTGFATTGSNTFNGNQTINGTLSLTGNSMDSGTISFPNNSQLSGKFGDQFKFATSEASALFLINSSSNASNMVFENRTPGNITLMPTNALVLTGSSVSIMGVDWITYSTSVDARIDTLEISGSRFATTGSNLFTGQQQIQSNNLQFNTTGSNTTNGVKFPNSSIFQNNFLNFETQGDVGVDFSTNNATVAGVNINFRNTNTSGDVQFTTSDGNVKLTAGGGGKQVSLTGSALVFNGVNFINFSSSVDSRLNAAGGGTAYTNPTLNPYSGSLILVGNTWSSSSFSYISASANGQTNLIFKADNNTGTTTISGSYNILGNPGTPGQGATFIRYLGNNNIALGTANAPQMTGSITYSPTMNNNFWGGSSQTYQFRLPSTLNTGASVNINGNILAGGLNAGNATNAFDKAVQGANITGNFGGGNTTLRANGASLASVVGFSNNYIGGAITINAASSSIVTSNSIINDPSFTITNNAYSASAGTGSAANSRLNVGGSGNSILYEGVGTFSSYSDNVIFGAGNAVKIDVSQTNNALNANTLLGKQLIVTASGVFPDTNGQYVGSVFIGRNNATDGNKAKTAETIFAVGTGTSSTNRKTGFLIDSGSNTFVEGTFNVSGSSSLTGSTFVSGALNVTGSITIQSGSTNDFYIYGHKQFNVGGFQTNVSKSGSAGVSQSIDFEITDVSYGVTMVSSSQMTFANAGVYNIQFSAQVECNTGADTAWIWLKKNGSNVAESATKGVLANNTAQVIAANFIVELASNDYLELAWQNNGGDAVLLAENASGNIPAIPSVIVTATQVR